MSSEAERWTRVWEVFHQALETDPAARSRVLDAACEQDNELRQEVEGLLAAYHNGLPLLDRAPPLDIRSTLSHGGRLGNAARYLQPGLVLAERFEIVRLLGVGGMGEVYEARDRELGSRVALKLLAAERSSSASALERFRHEIMLAQKVTHRNVCRVFDLMRHGALSFLTMELLPGETLAARLDRTGPLELGEARNILENVIAGLEAAHALGIVHRDLKPSNVILVDQPRDRRAVVTDFGLATSSGTTTKDLRLTRTGEIVGTLGYMAPEQLERGEVSTATDVYALGLMAYEMVTGRLPFTGDTAFSVARQRLEGPAPAPRLLCPDLDRAWDAAILRCLERRPADRFQHPRELLSAMSEPTLDPRAPTLAERTGRRPGAAVWLGMVAAALVAALGIAGYRTWHKSGPVGPAPLAAPAVPAAPTIKPMVLVASFDNHSGTADLDGLFASALAHELASSPFVSVAPHSRITDTLRLMRAPIDSKLDPELARQVAQRDGGISVIVSGSIERFGEGLAVHARLIAASDGSELDSWAETGGATAEEIRAVLDRIGRGVRQTLGESLTRVQADGDQLEKVTTPSWRALNLFDQAEAVIARFGLDRTAEELLREAIRDDPSFASAHIYLALALYNQRRGRDEVLAEAGRAMALADGVSDPERFFIRGGYFFLNGDIDRAIANYEALLRLQPDHYWANSNIAYLVGPTPGIPYMVRKARARPNDLDAAWDAAHALAIVGGRVEEAQAFIDRVVALASVEIPRQQEYEAAWARQWHAHRRWLAHDVEGTRTELDRLGRELQLQTGSEAFWTRILLIHGYRALGLAEQARELLTPPELGWKPQFYSGLDAFLNGDPEGTRKSLARSERAGAWGGQNLLEDPIRVAALARSGDPEAARNVSIAFRAPQYRVPEFEEKPDVLVAEMDAELELASGDAAAAASTLEKILGHDWEQYGICYHLAAQALAVAYRRLGHDREALAVLESAVARRAQSYPLGSEQWLASAFALADLQRELGRSSDAKRLDHELAELTRLADPDSWLRRRALEASGDR